MVAGSTPPLASACGRLGASVDALAGENLGGLSGTVLGADLIALRAAIVRLEAEFSRRL